MTKILIVVDMQNDFVDGSLGTPEAQRILATVIREIRDPRYEMVYATMDTHPQNYLETFEGKNLPVVHCVKGTKGWQINPLVLQELDKRKAVLVEKPTFGSVDLVHAMQKIQPEDITLIGLCTDICVISNALMLRAAMPDVPIHVISDACAGVTPQKHDAALLVMSSCQIDIH